MLNQIWLKYQQNETKQFVNPSCLAVGPDFRIQNRSGLPSQEHQALQPSALLLHPLCRPDPSSPTPDYKVSRFKAVFLLGQLPVALWTQVSLSQPHEHHNGSCNELWTCNELWSRLQRLQLKLRSTSDTHKVVPSLQSS